MIGFNEIRDDLLSFLTAEFRAGNTENLRSISQGLTRLVAALNNKIVLLEESNKELAESVEPIPSFGTTGLPTGKELNVILQGISLIGGHYQFIFIDSKSGKKFQLNRPNSAITTVPAYKVVEYTIKWITGKTPPKGKALETFVSLCNRKLDSKVRISVQPVSGALNFLILGKW